MNMVEIKDAVTGKILQRNTVNAREIVGGNPERFSFHGQKAAAMRLRPIVHDPAPQADEPATEESD